MLVWYTVSMCIRWYGRAITEQTYSRFIRRDMGESVVSIWDIDKSAGWYTFCTSGYVDHHTAGGHYETSFAPVRLGSSNMNGVPHL